MMNGTFQFNGKAYPAQGFSFGDVVLVHAAFESDAVFLLGLATAQPDTSAWDNPARIDRRTDRTGSNAARSGKQTSRQESVPCHCCAAQRPVQARKPDHKKGNAASARTQLAPTIVQPLSDSHHSLYMGKP